jgi:hypothetical protein
MLRCSVLFSFAIMAGTAALAQGITTGSIIGTVQDTQGAVVPGASVTLVEDATGATTVSKSLGDGAFNVRNLPIGVYTITISAGGFNPMAMQHVKVVAGVETDIGIEKLKAGTTAEVTVESTAPLLQTTQAQVSTEFTPQQIQSLPLNNGFDTLAYLIPGVVQTHDATFSDSNSNGGENISVNGQRGRSNNFQVDGQNNNDMSVTGPSIFFSNQDALKEVQVVTENFGAQYGRNMGAVVNYITNSGTNTFHGTAFEFYTGSFLNSLSNDQKNPLLGFCAPGQDPATTPCIVPKVPRSVENKYGGTIGGPVIKDKLWFFGSTYWDRITQGVPATTGTSTFPTPAGIAALLVDFPGNPGAEAVALTGPYAVLTGNPAPVGTPVMTNVTDGNTSATIPFAPISRSVASVGNDEEELGRIDWQPTGIDRFYVRYFYQNQLQTGSLAGNTSGTMASGGYTNATDTAHSAAADWTHAFTPAWLNQIHISFQQTKFTFDGGGVPSCRYNSFGSCPAEVDFGDDTAGFGYNSALPQYGAQKNYQVQENGSWSHRGHNILFGGEYDYINVSNVYLPFGYNGDYSLSAIGADADPCGPINPISGNAPDCASFNSLLGGVLSGGTPAPSPADSQLFSLGDGNPVIPLRESDAALYIQDDWKIRNDLTLNLGLRWEFFGQAFNELHNAGVAQQSNPATAFWDTSLPLSATTLPAVPNNWQNFQPRVGFAWNPSSMNRRLVVRGGYAINFDPSFYNIYLNVATLAPAAISTTDDCSGTSTCVPSGGTSSANVRAANLSLLPTGGNPAFFSQSTVASNLKNPYTQTYSLGVQYQFSNDVVVEVRYVGNHATRLFQAVNQNPNVADVSAAFPNIVSPSSVCTDTTAPGLGTRNCNVGVLESTDNTAFSIYNGLQTTVTTRNYHGLTSTFAYTYSKTIDNTSDILPTGDGGNTLEFANNPLNTDGGERGVSGVDYPNVFSVSFVYDLPKLVPGHGLLAKLANGFSLNGIYLFNTGQPFFPFQHLFQAPDGEPSFCDTNFNENILGVDSCRPILSNPKAPLNSVGFYDDGSVLGTPGFYDLNGNPIAPTDVHWLINQETTAIMLGNPYPGVSRNTLRGQSYNNLDASIFKTTQLTETVSFQLQMNVFNALNRQYRGAPDADISQSSFLSNAFNTSNNRSVQLGGKIIF